MSTLSRLSQSTVEAPISFLMREALARPELVSLAAGFVDQASLPLEETFRAVEGLLESSSLSVARAAFATVTAAAAEA